MGPTTVLQRLPKACDLLQQVADCVKTLGLPLPVDTNGYGVEGSEPISLITDADLDHLFPTSSRAPEAGVVSWSPPTQNWNPWSGCNIDEGPLASASMDDISQVTRFPWALLAFFSCLSGLVVIKLSCCVLNSLDESISSLGLLFPKCFYRDFRLFREHQPRSVTCIVMPTRSFHCQACLNHLG